MSLSDPIGDMIARIKNAQSRNHKKVNLPSSNFKTKIAGILKNEGQKAHFYFVHSFFSKPNDHRVVLGETMYGEVFASVISSENVFATQFHPEKSSENGILLLKNFAGWNP